MKKKYLQKISHYSTYIGTYEIEGWEENIRHNKPLAPEIVGFLIGRAQPVWENILCVVCKKPIEEGTEAKAKIDDLLKMRPDAHQTCYDKEMEKLRKANNL